MAFDNDKLNEALIRLAEIKGQVDRIVSDAESEKNFRKERNNNIDRQLETVRGDISELKQWKAELHGRIVVTISVASIVITGIIALLIKLVK
jgi:hypothetical protein